MRHRVFLRWGQGSDKGHRRQRYTVFSSRPESMLLASIWCNCGVSQELGRTASGVADDKHGLRIGVVIDRIIYMEDTVVEALYFCLRTLALKQDWIRPWSDLAFCFQYEIINFKLPSVQDRRQRSRWDLLIYCGVKFAILEHTSQCRPFCKWRFSPSSTTVNLVGTWDKLSPPQIKDGLASAVVVG